MKELKNAFARLLAVLSVLAAIVTLVYVVYQNWEMIRDFIKDRCPCCDKAARRAEFADYVD